MSLLGIDIGTTGCKAVVFNTRGQQLSRAYRSYSLQIRYPGFAVLHSDEVWAKI